MQAGNLEYRPTLILEYDMNVPDQPLNPPEPRCPDYNDYMEHECDRLIDEAKEREHNQNAGERRPVPVFRMSAHRNHHD